MNRNIKSDITPIKTTKRSNRFFSDWLIMHYPNRGAIKITKRNSGFFSDWLATYYPEWKDIIVYNVKKNLAQTKYLISGVSGENDEFIAVISTIDHKKFSKIGDPIVINEDLLRKTQPSKLELRLMSIYWNA
jgi:hypothetical protein